MKKRIICLLLALTLVLAVGFTLVACGGGGDDGGSGSGGNTDTPTCEHVDTTPCDSKCDKCGAVVSCAQLGHNYVGYKCARCNAIKTHECVDEKPADGKCDICGKVVEMADKEYDTAAWGGATTILYDMTENSNSEELSSGCKAYLAGEVTTGDTDIDNLVRARNANAIAATGVTPVYTYRADINDYAWSQNIKDIYELCTVKTPESPDVFCNFVYDIVCTSLRGAFANLNSKVRGANNFEFLKYSSKDDYAAKDQQTGYMYEYMRSLTLSPAKMYCLASNYYVDLVRAFFAVPVNVSLLEGIDATQYGELVADRDGEAGYTLGDFYAMVTAGEWDYNKVAEFSNAVYTRATSTPAGSVSLDDTLGFAVQNRSGLSSSGLLYTSSVSIIEHRWETEEIGDKAVDKLICKYPETNDALVNFSKALDKLFGSTGVLCVTQENCGTAEGTQLLQKIRYQFCNNNVLFGGVICVGSLEYADYQTLKTTKGGFGVAPVPVYKAGDKYLTQIHNVGRIGAINDQTDKFSACTAYLDYVSMHSTTILNTYYEDVLEYSTTDGDAGTVEMLEYIRKNVRSSFDKVFEDAIGNYYKGEDSTETLWHNILMANNYRMGETMAAEYQSLIGTKQKRLESLTNAYATYPD